MKIDPQILEKEAYAFLSQEKYAEAFDFFKRAAEVYRKEGNHKQSAICFASAASCWSKKSGEKTFANAALTYEKAALDTEKTCDFEYASLLYKYAAMNYERDGEYGNYSDCFYQSKETYRKFLTYRLFNPRKINPIIESKEPKGIKGAIRSFYLWLVLTFSFLIWGHGERPVRTFFTAIFIVALSAVFYTYGHLIKDGLIFQPDCLEAFYFSMVTFTTLGYGDIAPVGISKLISTCESFSGLFIMPLFIIGLSRKYLRI